MGYECVTKIKLHGGLKERRRCKKEMIIMYLTEDDDLKCILSNSKVEEPEESLYLLIAQDLSPNSIG